MAIHGVTPIEFPQWMKGWRCKELFCNKPAATFAYSHVSGQSTFTCENGHRTSFDGHYPDELERAAEANKALWQKHKARRPRNA
jgi:hypothetical protein